LSFGYWIEQEDGIFECQNLITITKKVKKTANKLVGINEIMNNERTIK
jgi:hypothetical protein